MKNNRNFGVTLLAGCAHPYALKHISTTQIALFYSSPFTADI